MYHTIKKQRYTVNAFFAVVGFGEDHQTRNVLKRARVNVIIRELHVKIKEKEQAILHGVEEYKFIDDLKNQHANNVTPHYIFAYIIKTKTDIIMKQQTYKLFVDAVIKKYMEYLNDVINWGNLIKIVCVQMHST